MQINTHITNCEFISLSAPNIIEILNVNSGIQWKIVTVAHDQISEIKNFCYKLLFFAHLRCV